MVHAFICSECEEARIRGALHDAAPLYRDAPEAAQARSSGKRIFHKFMQEALPGVPKAKRERAGAAPRKLTRMPMRWRTCFARMSGACANCRDVSDTFRRPEQPFDC